MNYHRIVLAITGPAGAGKSTVASLLAKRIDQCVNIDADKVKHFIVNGFVYDETPEGNKQWELLGTNLGLLARNFSDAGYNVILNGYINEPAWIEIKKSIQLTHKVLLLPHLDTVASRDAGRTIDVKMGHEAVAKHHAYFSSSSFYDDFVKLDTTSHTPEETTAAILKIVQ